jgi:TusA-related sulfurtransferase
LSTLDLTGTPCPLNWVKAKLALEQMHVGEEIVLLLDPGEAIESVPQSARDQGHDVTVEGTRVTIVKR